MAPGQRWGEREMVFGLLVAGGVALALRLTAVAQPLGIDQGLWASAARAMSHGQLLYRDLWEQRPPGIYVTYLAAFSAFGWRESTLAILDVIAAAVTAAALYGVAVTLASRLTAAVAVALYALLTMPASLYGYGGFLERSVCETFTVPLVALAAWAVARVATGSTHAVLLLGFAGLASGLAVVFKPNAGLYLPALATWLLLYGRWPPGARLGRLTAVGVLGSAAAVPVLVTLLGIVWLGIAADARVAVIDFNRFYVTAGATPGVVVLGFSKAVWLRMKTDPLWAIGGVAAVLAVIAVARDRRLSPLAGLAVIWGAAAAGVIIVNGIYLFNSYFINALAPLAVLSAWAVTEETAGRRHRRLLTTALVGLVLIMAAFRGTVPRVWAAAAADLAVLTGRLDRTTYLEQFGGYANRRGYSARANAELAAYVATSTTPRDAVFLIGINGASVYFLADRLPAHRFLRVNFFTPETFPNPAFTRRAVAADLLASRPRLLIFERLHTGAVNRDVDALPDHPDFQPLLAAYQRDAVIEDFTVYRRREAD